MDDFNPTPDPATDPEIHSEEEPVSKEVDTEPEVIVEPVAPIAPVEPDLLPVVAQTATETPVAPTPPSIFDKWYLILTMLRYMSNGTEEEQPAGKVVQFEPTDEIDLPSLITLGAVVEATEAEFNAAKAADGMVEPEAVIARGGADPTEPSTRGE